MRSDPPIPASLTVSPDFTTTLWSVVRRAGMGDGTSVADALAKLCQIYWYPLYAYARRGGHQAEDARDLTQGFFACILGTDFFSKADETKGRFRSFLLKSFARFLGDERARARAAKRGGGIQPISLDATEAETRYGLEPADERDPEKIFERRWAVTLIETTLRHLEAEFTAAGKAQAFAEMKPFLLGEADHKTTATLAQKLGIKPGAARTALHRLRQRYHELFREELAQTVNTPEELEDELRHVFRVLSS